jgi:hypothetical protein
MASTPWLNSPSKASIEVSLVFLISTSFQYSNSAVTMVDAAPPPPLSEPRKFVIRRKAVPSSILHGPDTLPTHCDEDEPRQSKTTKFDYVVDARMIGPPDMPFPLEEPAIEPKRKGDTFAQPQVNVEPQINGVPQVNAPIRPQREENKAAVPLTPQSKVDDYDEDAALEELLANRQADDKAPGVAFGLAPPQNWPINISVFPKMPITFEYDHLKYQQEFSYRWWITERVLGLTRTQTFPAYGEEIKCRMSNRRRVLGFADPPPPIDMTKENMDDWRRRLFWNRQLNAKFEADNAKVTTPTSGWTLNPGAEGPPLGEYPRPVPKLPEMQPQHMGLDLPDPAMELESILYPESRAWSTEEELRRFPLYLSQIHPAEFASPPVSPEILFTDRLGVVMKGVAQTPQCSERREHVFSRRKFVEWLGYDFHHASHGLTYEDYRRMIAGSIAILERNGVSANRPRVREELKQFFYGVSDSLRARGVPVVIKFKSPQANGDMELWESHDIVMSHLPLNRKMRRRGV